MLTQRFYRWARRSVVFFYSWHPALRASGRLRRSLRLRYAVVTLTSHSGAAKRFFSVKEK